jgi:uncharacterized membrane protein
MAFCPNCGSQVEGKFCAKCGSAVADAPGGGFAPPPAAPAQSAGMEENVASALCYSLTLLTGILFLVLEPYNKNKTIRFHAFQAIFFWAACVAVLIVLTILSMSMAFVGLFVFSFLHMIAYLGFFVVWALLIYKAYNREKFVLPIIGPIAEKQA